MVHVDRTRVKLPTAIAAALQEEQRRLIQFQRQISAGSKRYQQRTFAYSAYKATAPVLQELFRGKCAYCETLLIGQPGDVEHFRPKRTIQELDGKVLREGYWWLANDWENLYLSCRNCSILHKRNKFPILGERARPLAHGKALLGEKALLIDPCVEDPAKFLWFAPDGTVHSRRLRLRKDRAAAAKGDPAAVTIDILGLNRSELVEARRRIRVQVEDVLRRIKTREARVDTRLITGPDKPYAGAARQWLAEATTAAETEGAKPHPRGKPTRPPGKPPSDALVSPPTLAPESAPVPTEKAPEAVVAKPVFIKRISFRNFKALRRLDIELPIAVEDDLESRAAATNTEPDSEASTASTSRTGWFVFLGENAVGKSSILEGIALAAMGEAHLRGLVDAKTLSLAKLVYLPPDEDPAKNNRTCVIRLTLAPEELGEIELRITRSSFKFTKGGAQLPTLIRGYGFVRLLPRPGEDPDRTISLARAENLFDPRAPLCDAERWMASLPYDKKKTSSFDIAASTILALFPRSTLVAHVEDAATDEAAHLAPKNGRVVMTLRQRELSLDQLSSGYQSVIALAADIMSGIPADRLFDMREACGIVLIDEIGTQLHPRWRMHAIDDLRKAFPGIQFIATTHEPLCLKGVGHNEVAVLRRDGPEDDVTAITEGFQNPRLLRVDQLLTSPLFGLDSTIDPHVDRMFQRYFELLAQKRTETAAQRDERERLELQLAPHRGLGYTRSDQAVYALLEDFLATEGAATQRQAQVVSEPVRRQIFDIWRNVAARHRTQP